MSSLIFYTNSENIYVVMDTYGHRNLFGLRERHPTRTARRNQPLVNCPFKVGS